MLVMLSCGKNSNQIVKTASTQLDNVDFYCYYSVDEFINQSKLRHLVFDRLVFTSKFVNSDKDMNRLCDYIRKESNSAEIVMILPKTQTSMESVFKKYFDSPMYTVMYVDNPTTMCIVDAVKLPIADVKARYYSLDKEDLSSDKKQSKIGVFKGGKKNKNQNVEIKKDINDDLNSLQNGIESGIKNTSNFDFETNAKDVLNSGSSDINENFGNADSSSNTEFGYEGFSSDSDKVPTGEIPSNTTDDLDLSIGDFGSQHADSGFVGDDDLSELEEYANSKNDLNKGNTEISYEDIPKKEVKTEVNTLTRNNSSFVKDISSSSTMVNLSKINIITGVNGSGVTPFVVSQAMKVAKTGKKVLIINLDYKNNGLLSFIDIHQFYSRGYYDGLNTKRFYSEDCIDILSNGYGVQINRDIKGIINKNLMLSYDLILVDCPIDCLDVVPDDVFCGCNVLIGCISDLSKLLETSLKLSDRNSVSLRKEIYISEKCKVANKNISIDDINIVKSLMMFPNGCWLDNY